MSKIICDVCGTAFAENAAQCPICGSAKRRNPVTVNGNNDAAEESGYKTVKGGRFSKRNVRKRNQESARQSQPERSDNGQDEEKNNKGLMILMFVLIGAVIAVFLYIILRLTGPAVPPTEPTNDPTTVPTTAPTGEPTDPTTNPTTAPTTEVTVPCEGLTLRVPRIELDTAGGTAAIHVSANPVDTTDPITFVSSDESVAKVDAAGNVTAVGNGQATVTITCGKFHVDCVVVVNVPTEPTTEPTTAPTEPTTEPAVEFKLNRKDITMFKAGETWDLYDGKLPLTTITWTSDDESVATIKNGIVTAVGPGVTTVYGEYEGKKVKCVIRCRWDADATTEPTTPELDPNETYTISKTDVSIKVGESFFLTLRDSDGNVVSVDWKASKSGYVKIEGNKITGLSSINSSSFKVYVKIGDNTYSCVVRVK